MGQDHNWNFGELCPNAGYVWAIHCDKKYYKIIPCGRETCPVCGRKGSMLHKQRFMRGLVRINQMSALGYFVVTFPLAIRESFLDRELLSKFMDWFRELMKEFGFKRGVMRWHWAGDENKVFHPHLNVLVEGRFLSYKEVVYPIKCAVISWVRKHIKYKGDGVTVRYSYCKKKAKKFHKWRYVCRPTMLLLGEDMWKVDMFLHGFRNTRWWGSWDFESNLAKKVKDWRTLSCLERGICPVCGSELSWVYKPSFKFHEQSVLQDAFYIGAGYLVGDFD